jgi:DNA-binding transcriptional regulator YhcF (GntR family)
LNPLAGRIRLDFRADDPIYLQIVRQIEALVAEGTLKAGDQLPTVRELAIDLRINFSTVARAYRILDEQRLISTQRGRGTYIWDESPPVPAQQESAAPLQVTESRLHTDRLAGLAQRFIREAAGLGAAVEQIEQVFQQQMDGWKRDHPDHFSKSNGGK